MGFSIMLGVIANVLAWATKELQEEWAPPLISGEKMMCYGFTEPDAGSDVAALKSTAVRDGDYYVLNGEKTSLTAADKAHICQFFCKTNPAAGIRGISLILLPLERPGIERTRFDDMGWHAIGRASIAVNNVRVPVRNLVGGEGDIRFLLTELDNYRVFLAIQSLGLAQASIDDAME